MLTAYLLASFYEILFKYFVHFLTGFSSHYKFIIIILFF